jgi:hypothetical protein
MPGLSLEGKEDMRRLLFITLFSFRRRPCLASYAETNKVIMTRLITLL